MTTSTPSDDFIRVLSQNAPDAVALIRGNEQNPNLNGMVTFYQTPYYGILIEAEIYNLPDAAEDTNTSHTSNFYAMHIHETGDCMLPFDKTGAHFNPANQPHPFHAGDLLPLLSSYGYAWSAFYTERLSINDIIGRSLIIHQNPDDFTTQPSGNSGTKIGCGVIERTNSQP